MLKRTSTGAVYVAIIVGFFLLRDHVDYRLFNILTFVFCAVGTFEVARAVKEYLYYGNFTLAVIFGTIYVSLFCVFQYFVDFKGGYLFCLIFTAALLCYQCVFAAVKEKNVNGKNFTAALKAFAVNALPFCYPSLLLLTVLLANELQSGFICLLLIFVISPCSDTFAYLVGMIYNKIRKGNAKKMCPRLSPKKTWAGAIGGVIGGIAGAVALYFIVDKTTMQAAAISPLLIFIITGAVASVLTEIGDLFESFIKRKVGIKDMGKIMPGHGGVMDRIDGMSFAAVFIYITFLLFV
ncbi:MAG: phosphatidate cytidylyltransferase [Clostridia bacterium]|nr:phosphatidate cytidylyltransferase [Clostridia bacterium]